MADSTVTDLGLLHIALAALICLTILGCTALLIRKLDMTHPHHAPQTQDSPAEPAEGAGE